MVAVANNHPLPSIHSPSDRCTSHSLDVVSVLVVVDDVEGDELVVTMIPVVVNYQRSKIVSSSLSLYKSTLTLALGDVVEAALVVTVGTVGCVVVFVAGVVDERPGSQMLKNQNDGSVIGADSGPTRHRHSALNRPLDHTYHRTRCHSPHLQMHRLRQSLSASVSVTYRCQT